MAQSSCKGLSMHHKKHRAPWAAASLIVCLLAGAGAAHAQSMFDKNTFDSGRLLLTGGVSNVEGAAGGGIATWGVITGYGTRDAIGANVHATYLGLKDYELRDYGAWSGSSTGWKSLTPAGVRHRLHRRQARHRQWLHLRSGRLWREA